MRKVPNINTHIFKQPNLPWSLETVSDEAQDMLDNYSSLGVALLGDERAAMIAYVDSEVASGNHSKKDYEVIFSLAGVNSLVDYVGGKVATAVNAPVHNVDGYTFDGTNWMNGNFNPFIDGVNYVLDDGALGLFLHTNNSVGVEVILGVQAANSEMRSDTVTFRSQGETSNIPIGTTFANKTLNVLTNNATNQIFWQDGIMTANQASVWVHSLPNANLSIASRSLGSFAWRGTISSIAVHASNSFNYPDNNTNLRVLLTTLGALP